MIPPIIAIRYRRYREPIPPAFSIDTGDAHALFETGPQLPPHAHLAHADPCGAVDDAVHDGVGVDPAAEPGVPVLLAELGAEDGGRRAVAGLHEPGQEAPEELVGAVGQPLVEHEDLEGRVPPRDLALAAGALARLAPVPLQVGAPDVAGPHPPLAGGPGDRAGEMGLARAGGPRGTTLWPRSAKPQVASSAIGSRSGPRPSEESMGRTSASGHLRLARLVRLRALGATKAERASPTAVCARSAQAMPMHMPSSRASRAPGRSAAPMSRGLRLVSTERPIALRLPAEVGAAHVAGLVLAGPAAVRARSGDQALAGLEDGLEAPVPGRGRAARERHRARPPQPRPRVAALEPERGEGRVEAPPLAVDAPEDAAHHPLQFEPTFGSALLYSSGSRKYDW